MSASPPPNRPAGSEFFDWIRRQQVFRGPDRWISGVASGLGRRLGWDPVLVRGLFVVAAIFSGLGVLLYGAAWLVVPDALTGRSHLEDAIRGRFSPGFWGSAALTACGIVLVAAWLPFTFPVGAIWLVALIIAAVVVCAYAINHGPAAPQWQGAQPAGPYPGPQPAGPYPGAQPAQPAFSVPDAAQPAQPAFSGPDAAQPPPAPSPDPPTAAYESGGSVAAAAGAATAIVTEPAPNDSDSGELGPEQSAGRPDATESDGSRPDESPDATTQAATTPDSASTDESADQVATAGGDAKGADGDEPTSGEAPASSPGGDSAAQTEANGDGEPTRDTPTGEEGSADGTRSAGASTPPAGQSRPTPSEPAAGGNGGRAASGNGAENHAGWPGGPYGAPPPPPRRAKGGALTLALLGVMLLAIALLAAMSRYTTLLDGMTVVGWCFGGALVVMGGGLVVLGLAGRRAGGFIAASIVLALVAVPLAAGAHTMDLTKGSMTVGSYEYMPITRADAEAGYVIGAGELFVDLTDPALRGDGDLTVEIVVGMGTANVVVPAGGAVVIDAAVSTGQIVWSGFEREQWRVDWSATGARDRDSTSPVRGTTFEGERVDDELGGLNVTLRAETVAADDGPTLTIKCRGGFGLLEINDESLYRDMR
ncbi:MAG: PspC domain-containing protein [Bifidobacteriaceae bacterium]|jgi:phage shock protein PspC (stress-responsive transcriptional regulator)|nr:PspC domain-containing protein [Bifidobacteriaceae bacterium]